MSALAASSPGLHALMTACTSDSTLPNNAFQTNAAKPITGMSILQLASPPPSSLPPPSPNSFPHQSPLPPHQSASMIINPHQHPSATRSSARRKSSAADADASHAASAATAATASTDDHSNEGDEGEEGERDGSQSMDEDDEEELEEEDEDPRMLRDGADSVSSQSCPPSPLASLALLSADAASQPTNLNLGASRSRPTSKSLLNMHRRRSVGSHSERAHSSDRASSAGPNGAHASSGGTTFKRPPLTATSATGFKKKHAADANSAGGSSCHQCKSRRNYGDLTFCTSSLSKKNKNAVCRKKFCDACLRKFYREQPHPMSSVSAGFLWTCPSCRKICCCAACRRREQRDDDPNGNASLENTPHIKPLYPHADHDDGMQTSPLQSPSASPTALSMQRLLLSPTQHSLSPLPPSTGIGGTNTSAAAAAATNPHSNSLLSPPAKLPRYNSPRNTSPLSESPPPLGDADSLRSNLASLTALSQAAMRDSPHSITIALQNRNSASALQNANPAHHTFAQPTASSHHPQTQSSLASSTVTSPSKDARNLSMPNPANGVSTPSLVTGTPKMTATSVYSNLLLNGVMLTPRLLPRSAASILTTPASLPLSSSAPQSAQKMNTPASMTPHMSAVTGDTSLSSTDDQMDSQEVMSVLPSFALFYALGQLPAVQRDVASVLHSSDGSKNRDRLKKIEEIFYNAAERVMNEEMPLQL